jgi:DNA-binding MurR/RpiR family transcriptional regulator
MKNLKILLRDRTNGNSSKFTPTDQKIAYYLLRPYPQGLFENASQISKKLRTDVLNVTRFSLKLSIGVFAAFNVLSERLSMLS